MDRVWLVWSWLRVACTILYHKLVIVVAGCHLNAHLPPSFRLSWRRMLVHDLSKFHPAEFFAYACHYYGANAGKRRDQDPDFDLAFAHHTAHNDHHPEFFETKNGEVGRMNDAALVEMVADLFAANQAYQGSWPRPGEWAWLQRSWPTLHVHPVDKALLGAILSVLGFEADMPSFDWTDAERTIHRVEQDDDSTAVKKFKELREAYNKKQHEHAKKSQ